MNDVSKHGGKRAGAGRKTKWTLEYVLEVGLACEKLWRAEQQAAFERRKDNALSNTLDIGQHYKNIQAIPVNKRAAWLETEAADIYFYDFEAEIEQLNDPRSPANPENRVFSFSNRPPPGTRALIIEKMSIDFGLKPKQVDNIWQQYRRFERKYKEG